MQADSDPIPGLQSWIEFDPNAEVEAEVDVVKGRREKRLNENRTVG
jgi:hypothetical protein